MQEGVRDKVQLALARFIRAAERPLPIAENIVQVELERKRGLTDEPLIERHYVPHDKAAE